MKSNALLGAAVVGLALALVTLPASAHRGYRGSPSVHFSFGSAWGPYWGPRYYGPGYYWAPPPVYYAPPPVVVVPREPRVYVERDEVAPAAAAPSEQWWYWCASSRAYYPYVSTCSEGWQRVAPQPTQAPR
jgi:hypothetical protein